jgi:hypothetical protein
VENLGLHPRCFVVLVEPATPEECAAAAGKRRRAAAAHRPRNVRFLLIAQTPPDELDRYFYFRRVPKADYLFQAVVPHFLGEPPTRLDMRRQLSALSDLGVCVIDPKPDPCDRRDVTDFADDVVRRALRHSPQHAILIKVDVYDRFRPLREAGVPVIDRRIPFPSTGRQSEFFLTFAAALETAGWQSRAKRG